MSPPQLEIQDLRTSFLGANGWVPVVDGVSLSVPRGRTVALVGESGCGKSVTGLSILRLIPPTTSRIEGRVLFHDSSDGRCIDLVRAPARVLWKVRGGRIAMIFQEPMSSLNPVFTVGEQIVETIIRHRRVRGRAAWGFAAELLSKVGIPDAERRVRDYPHQLSGGMLQRIMIAVALAGQPSLLIADEPTTALDVTVQRQVLELLRSIQQVQAMSMLLITHDLGVVAHFADEVYVMYAGRVVEHGAVREILQTPLHPYTKGLLACTPRLSSSGRLTTIRGQVPLPADYPRGCRFHLRCDLTAERAQMPGREIVPVDGEAKANVLRRCRDGEGPGASCPPLRGASAGHFVACWERFGESDLR